VTKIASAKGSAFLGLVCDHPFIDRESKIVNAQYVSSEEGTGCVHIAPGHGQDDYVVGLEYDLPVISPVDEKGRFTADFEPAQGQKVLKANTVVTELLSKDGNLLNHESFQHSYPHCWRCKSPLIFRATKQWFLHVDHKDLRKRLIATVNDENKSKWIPGWGKNRILAMLEDRPDWCLSRQRYWGVAIPIFYCEACGKDHLTAEIAEKITTVIKEENADAWFYRDNSYFLPKDFSCEDCGKKEFSKETDILDVWFDSGTSHQAVAANHPELTYPADLYLEGSDQHRGWFQTSLITSVAMHDTAPFREVLTHGFTVDAEGKKMSKSMGNVVSPQDVMKKYGADILRLWVSSCDYSSDVRISEDILKQMSDAYRKIRNTFKYILGNIDDFDHKKDAVPFEKLDEIDKWALGECMLLVEEVTEAYDHYKFHQIYRLVYDFCIKEMSSFYLDILKDRLYTAGKTSLERRSSQTAMFYILRNLVKILAPILPFTCEEVWQTRTIDSASKSIHCADWPGDYPELINAELIEKWRQIIAFRDFVNGLIENERAQGIIGSSLEATITIDAVDPAWQVVLDYFKPMLPFILIVSEVSYKATGSAPSSSAAYMQQEGTSLCTVAVSKADGEKCERCWMRNSDIGKDTKHSTICPKCIAAIASNEAQ